MTPDPTTSRRAFTLVELLSVIAIIGVLSGIILVVVGRSRAKAFDARCVSMQRQLGVAVQLFVLDNQNRFPGPCYAGVRKGYSTKSSDSSFFGFIAPYVGLVSDDKWRNADSLMCPAWSLDVINADQAPVYMLSDSVTLSDGTTVNPWGYPSKSTPIRSNQIANPASTWWLKDIDQKNASANASWYASLPRDPVHGNGKTRNALFGDYSVRSVPSE
jgi:prepilin-type N-terminal cleavage/methylation domain-containing protein